MNGLIKCKKCGKSYGEWSFRKNKGIRVAICKACETENKAQRIRRDQDNSTANHLKVQQANKRNKHEWERKASARVRD